MKAKIQRGDTVQIITGKRNDKGQRGEVIRVIGKTNRVVIQGLNMNKKHQREMQTQGRSIPGGVVEYEGPMPISNVMLVCPSCDEPTRVGISFDDDGEAHRMCKKCESEID